MEKEQEKIKLSPAEIALLKFWRSYVPSYDPRKNQYLADVHTFPNRTMVYYFMTEDLIEYFKQCDVPQYSATALLRMKVSPSTLKSWRDQGGKMWRKLRL